MAKLKQLSLHNLFYTIPNTAVSFDSLNLAFSAKRYGIIGDNGVGKTTLLKLIAGELVLQQGSIQCNGSIAYCPQHYVANERATVADVLDVAQKLKAMAAIAKGSVNQQDYELVADQWDLKETIQTALLTVNLADCAMTLPFSNLSGGQKTKLLLARMLLTDADFILLDEPTNNLDAVSRDILYQWVKNTHKGLLLVSHDRHLLNAMDETIELTTKGVFHYGGDYDFYCEQKEIHEKALRQEIAAKEELLKKTKQLAQVRKERHEQNEAKGRKAKKAQIKAKGSYDKMAFKTQQGRSEKTNKRIRVQAENNLSLKYQALQEVKEKIEHKHEIHVDLHATKVANSKVVLEIENLSFSYMQNKLLFSDFNLKIQGPKRLAIIGDNGCGKTTLLKLILGKLKPVQGRVMLALEMVCYLDQQVSFLDGELTLLDNFQKINPNISTRDAYFALASMNFRNQQAQKQIKHLSGGERIRAGLAISLLSEVPPQLIILDEPTNHLDVRSIEIIESILSSYQGAMIVISHDRQFLRNILVDEYLAL